MKLTTAQIGRCGELLVQYALLARGIESAALSTDTGVDLVAYSPSTKLPSTIQVKTNRAAKPGGGKGAPLLDWWLRADSPAQLVALVDMASQRIWLFTHEELLQVAQQRPANGLLHFFMKPSPSKRPRADGRPRDVAQFEQFLLEHRFGDLFDFTPESPALAPRND